jgi:hypothetical protein
MLHQIIAPEGFLCQPFLAGAPHNGHIHRAPSPVTSQHLRSKPEGPSWPKRPFGAGTCQLWAPPRPRNWHHSPPRALTSSPRAAGASAARPHPRRPTAIPRNPSHRHRCLLSRSPHPSSTAHTPSKICSHCHLKSRANSCWFTALTTSVVLAKSSPPAKTPSPSSLPPPSLPSPP